MGTKKKDEADERLPTENPFRDRTNRFAVNDLIRKNGYQIYERKKNKEPIWQKANVLFKESEVLTRLDSQDLWNAEYLESLYWSGLEV